MTARVLWYGRDSGVKDLKALNGATVCVAQGTTHEVTLGDYGRANASNGSRWCSIAPIRCYRHSSAGAAMA